MLGTDCDEYFRIHPKGTGIVCTDPNGIPAHVVISEYLGEMYPPYRWCEKLDVVQQAQKIYELKPTLPDFYNILLERPRRDPAGYGKRHDYLASHLLFNICLRIDIRGCITARQYGQQLLSLL